MGDAWFDIERLFEITYGEGVRSVDKWGGVVVTPLGKPILRANDSRSSIGKGEVEDKRSKGAMGTSMNEKESYFEGNTRLKHPNTKYGVI